MGARLVGAALFVISCCMARSLIYLYTVKIGVSGPDAAVKQNLYSVKIAIYKAPMATRPNNRRNAAGRSANTGAPARGLRKRSAPRTVAESEEAPYHHGALRDALLKAAERVLERDGLSGLTLRAVAREAGVSHAAPTHHFGDLTGLLSELAAIGFRQFNAAMVEAGAAGTSPIEKGMTRAKAYVAFAQAHPGIYGLMFRTERLDMTRPSLHEAASASFAGLAGAIGASRHEQITEDALSLEQAAAIARAWSLVHGFTMLLLDGRLADILRRLPKGTSAETLLEAMLRSTVWRPGA
jgi:AcrR family transcriptional regulator